MDRVQDYGLNMEEDIGDGGTKQLNSELIQMFDINIISIL